MTQPARTQTLPSQHDFATTVSRLRGALTSRGITVFAEIDQRAAAESAGTTLRPTQLFIFGNPKAGTPLMHLNPHAAIELPLRAVVWEEENGATYIDYQDIAALSADYAIPSEVAAPLVAIRTLLQNVAGAS